MRAPSSRYLILVPVTGSYGSSVLLYQSSGKRRYAYLLRKYQYMGSPIMYHSSIYYWTSIPRMSGSSHYLLLHVTWLVPCTCASCDRWKLYPCFRFSKNPSFTANPSSGTLELHSLNEVTEWKACFWVYTIGTWSLLLASFRVGNLLCNQKSEITLKQCCSQPSLVAAQDDANFLDWVPFSWMKILQLPSWIRQNLVS